LPKDINKSKFTEETKLKLDIFREFFREWFPVFLNNPFIDRIYIYDFFAGSGTDDSGVYGSPLILLDEVKKYCEKANSKPIVFSFNEKQKEKIEALKISVEDYFLKCFNANLCKENCKHKGDIVFSQKEFKEMFQETAQSDILCNDKFGKFILLDQYGFKEVDEQIFLKLINAPKTDFIFFISSSFISRFKNQDSVKKYFDTSLINFDENKPKECHRVITEYYKSFIPESKEYYLHPFTIQNGANYYGLIFGTNHTLGMEKFLKVCWRKDLLAGESNCNVNNDYDIGGLFYQENNTNKKMLTRESIKQKILSREIADNISGMKYSLKMGCLPKLFIDVVVELIGEKKIEIIGEFNKQASNIHKMDKYLFEVAK